MARERQRAWVAWNARSRTYSGYLASLTTDGDESSKVGDAPEGLEFEEIIAWARESAAEVFVRPHWDSDTTYWAGDGEHDAHPVLDQERAGEPAEIAGDAPITISGVVANCADCDWHGTFSNQAELLAAYAAHAHDHHGGSART